MTSHNQEAGLLDYYMNIIIPRDLNINIANL